MSARSLAVFWFSHIGCKLGGCRNNNLIKSIKNRVAALCLSVYSIVLICTGVIQIVHEGKSCYFVLLRDSGTWKWIDTAFRQRMQMNVGRNCINPGTRSEIHHFAVTCWSRWWIDTEAQLYQLIVCRRSRLQLPRYPRVHFLHFLSVRQRCSSLSPVVTLTLVKHAKVSLGSDSWLE